MSRGTLTVLYGIYACIHVYMYMYNNYMYIYAYLMSVHAPQVTLVHVSAVAKNAADDKLRQSLRRFAHTYPSPSTVVLVSSDVNFSSELNDLHHVHNLNIVLVHNRATSNALKVFAHTLVDYEQFLEDVEGPDKIQVCL